MPDLTMSDILVAASPVEIEVLADTHGLDDTARQAALTLFHRLTSELEMDEIAIAHGPTWPHHRFYFGRSNGPIAALLNRIATIPNLVDATAKRPVDTAAPPTLFVQGLEGTHTGLLLAAQEEAGLNALNAQ